MSRTGLVGVASILLLLLLGANAGDRDSSDIVIFGGTSCGVSAAISACRTLTQKHIAGSVTLLVNNTHVGGMTTGGLSETDLRDESVLGGYAKGFYTRAGRLLQPHLAEQILRSDLAVYEKANQLNIVYNTLGLASVETENSPQGRKIKSITTYSGQTYEAAYFIDCSYEGDIVSKGGISYSVGREPAVAFNESRGGVQGWPFPHSSLGQQFPLWENYTINPFINGTQELLPRVSKVLPHGLVAGEGDDQVMSYNFRLCITTNSCNRVPFVKPHGYSPKEFEVLARYLSIEPEKHQLAVQYCHPAVRQPGCGMFIMSALPGNKVDLNALGPISTDVLGPQNGWPLGNRTERMKIFDEHKFFTQSLLYFMANDPQVPSHMRTQFAEYGLCKDEFVDSGNWPTQLYVRESVRLNGSYLMTQHDVTVGGTIRKPSSIGLGDWEIDSHHVQRVAIPDPTGSGYRVIDEGEVEGNRGGTATTYEVPYEAIIPQRADCVNLLVPVCISSTHVAFATYRLEPQYFIIGESAGVAAAMLVQSGSSAVQDIDISELQNELVAAGQVIHLKS